MKATYEINTNGRDITFCVSVVRKSKQQTGFSHTRISDQQQLKQVIANKRSYTRLKWHKIIIRILIEGLEQSTKINKILTILPAYFSGKLDSKWTAKCMSSQRILWRSVVQTSPHSLKPLCWFFECGTAGRWPVSRVQKAYLQQSRPHNFS